MPCEYDSLLGNEYGDRFLYGAVKTGKITLFDSDGYEILHNVDIIFLWN